MSERNGYEPGVPCWVDTRQPDPRAATDFYTRLFGWQAERAAELGGTVVAGPFDMSIGRRAVLADPQRATFSISRVVPPA